MEISRGAAARRFVRAAGLFFVRTARARGVRVLELPSKLPVLVIGLSATPDMVVTEACRHVLTQKGECTDAALRAMVTSAGFVLVEPGAGVEFSMPPGPALRSADPRPETMPRTADAMARTVELVARTAESDARLV